MRDRRQVFPAWALSTLRAGAVSFLFGSPVPCIEQLVLEWIRDRVKQRLNMLSGYFFLLSKHIKQ